MTALPPTHGYGEAITEAARKGGVDPVLLEALVWQESSFRTDAFRWEPEFYERYLVGKPEWEGWIPRRVASSYGLCQIMYPTAREAGFIGPPEGLFVPEVNLAWGVKILRGLLEWAQGEKGLALAAYNGGKGGAGGLKPRAYAIAVLDKARVLRADKRSV